MGRLIRAFPKMASSEVKVPEARMLAVRLAKPIPLRA
jgi:hypothetical protein